MTVWLARNLFMKWNTQNICYCHWKGNEHLTGGLDGNTDLDVLLSKAEKVEAEEVLVSLGFIKCKSQYGSRYPGVDDWIGHDSPTGKMIHIHLYYQIITGHKGIEEYKLPWSDLTLQTRGVDDATSVYIMEPSLELVTFYTRFGLKASVNRMLQARNGLFSLGEDDKKEINFLKEKADWDKIEKLLLKFYKGYSDKMRSLIQKDTFGSEDLIQLAQITALTFKAHRTHGYVLSSLQMYYYAVVLRVISFVKNRMGVNIITRKTLESRGFMIAFIGQDGSGKSTVTDNVVTWLTWKIEAKKFYLGSGENYYSWQKKFRNLIPKNKNALFSALSAWLTLNDFVVLAKHVNRTIVRAERYISKGGIAIFDRYPQIIYPGINDGQKIRCNYVPRIKNKFVKKYAEFCADREEKYLLKAVTHTPDLVYKLMIPPEISIERKPDENIEIVRRKHEIIKEMEFCGSKVHVVDATQRYDEEIKLIRRSIWEKIIQK
jgi:thymidylate kinase